MNIKIIDTTTAISDSEMIISCANSFESLVSTLSTVKSNFESNWTGEENADRDSIIMSLNNSINFYQNKIIPALKGLGNGIYAYAIATEQLARASVGNPTLPAGITPSEYSDINKKNSANGEPDFSNEGAWGAGNRYSQDYMGQCTWFAWGKFYEMYGYDPGFGGNGKQCVEQLLWAHPDKFYASTEPATGAVFSTVPFNNDAPGHVGIITKVDGDMVTYFDGNYNNYNDSFERAQTDWKMETVTLEEFRQRYGSKVHFANPVVHL